METQRIRYWYNVAKEEIGTFVDETSITILDEFDSKGLLFYKEIGEREGIVAYTISKDFLGNKILAELFMYIKKEFRGNPRNMLKLISIMENEAQKNGCKYVCIASNIGYRDEKVLNILKKLGYFTDSVKKEMCCKR